MPDYVRWRTGGAAYFFTVVAHRRRRILIEPLARRCLRRAIKIVQSRWPFDIFAFVLLPDHLHCIWRLPEDDDNFPVRWANIKRLFTQTYLTGGGTDIAVSENRRKHHERGIWQPRYWEHLIRNESECLAYRDYIHLNPVKHGFVVDPIQWPWLSVHRHLQLGWIDRDWTGWTPIKVDIAGE